MARSASETASLAPEILAKYEPVIGLEVHVQLLTKTKIFCGCSTRFGDPPNTNVCPVCLGLPGTLPVVNKRAVELAMQAALALNCTVHEHSRFARKNYFYPDLPKGYQISQYELPLATGGERQFVLGNLVALGEVGVEIVFASEAGMVVDRAVQGERGAHGHLDGALVEHGQSAGEAEADGTDIGVGRIAEASGAAAEDFCAREELDVDFQADDRLVFREHVGGDGGGLWSGFRHKGTKIIASGARRDGPS